MPSLPNWSNGKSAPPPLPRIPVPAARAIVDCAVYVDGTRLPGKFTHNAALDEVRRRGKGFVWVGIHAPDESQMQDVAKTFGLHELMVEDAVHAHERPKLERYDDVMFLVLRTVVYVPHDSVETANEIVETGEIMVFVGPDFVVTVRHGDHSELASVRKALEQLPERLAMGPWSVLHAITDHVVDTYLSVTQLVEQDVDNMEELVFNPRNSVAVEHIYLLKREIVELRRSVTPLGMPLLQLTQPAGALVPKEIRRYFRDVRDHHTIVSERISEYDEVLSSLVDAALAKIAVQQNTDMRKISAWVAIAAVPTGIAGIYGMNFENMPELGSQYGYPMVMVFIASVCVGLFFLFRRNNWL